MNCDEQVKFFFEHKGEISYRATAIYFALLEISRACKLNPFTASSRQVMKKLNMKSMNTYTKAKKELIDKGLIMFIPSKVYGTGSTYGLCSKGTSLESE